MSGKDAPSAWADELADGLDALGIAVPVEGQAALIGYLERLQSWNRRFNLTAVRDPGEVVGRHLLDSLSILPWVDRGPVLDVGTGAGLPGIPLAIARPAIGFTLLDSNGKKTRFLRQVVAELGLDNVDVEQVRVERFDARGRFAVVTSRAFASLGDMYAAVRPLLRDDGRCLAMKGLAPTAEVAELPAGVPVEVVRLQVPGTTVTRHLVIIGPVGTAPAGPGRRL
jgi:16S rRNA (guanine527-N7)-methyltransferase